VSESAIGEPEVAEGHENEVGCYYFVLRLSFAADKAFDLHAVICFLSEG
jgi:hypothetical protein